jgi:hypothetical protein
MRRNVSRGIEGPLRCEFCRRKVTVLLDCGTFGHMCNDCYEAAYSFLKTRSAK